MVAYASKHSETDQHVSRRPTQAQINCIISMKNMKYETHIQFLRKNIVKKCIFIFEFQALELRATKLMGTFENNEERE